MIFKGVKAACKTSTRLVVLTSKRKGDKRLGILEQLSLGLGAQGLWQTDLGGDQAGVHLYGLLTWTETLLAIIIAAEPI